MNFQQKGHVDDKESTGTKHLMNTSDRPIRTRDMFENLFGNYEVEGLLRDWTQAHVVLRVLCNPIGAFSSVSQTSDCKTEFYL